MGEFENRITHLFSVMYEGTGISAFLGLSELLKNTIEEAKQEFPKCSDCEGYIDINIVPFGSEWAETKLLLCNRLRRIGNCPKDNWFVKWFGEFQ